MARRLVVKPDVSEDLHNIVEYLESWSLTASNRFMDAVFAAFDDLTEMPGKGSPKRFREKRFAGLRTWFVPGFRKYLIFFQANNEALIVLAVLHGARNVRKLLRQRR